MLRLPATAAGGTCPSPSTRSPRTSWTGSQEFFPASTAVGERDNFDYLYRAEDLSAFAGRRYSGQRNHINKFRKLYPDAVYRELTPADRDKVDAFWHEFHKVFNKEDADAKMEVCFARRLMEH